MSPPFLDAPIPSSLRVTRDANGLSIIYRWLSSKYLGFLVFCVFWDGWLVLWYSNVLRNPTAPNALTMLWFPIGHVAVGLAMTYITIAGFLNRTVLRVSSGIISMDHQPLPWPGGRSVQASEIRQLYREQLGGSSRSGPRYRLSAALRDGSKLVLMTLDSPDVPLVLEQEIEKHLGIQDIRVIGEMPK